jgi:UDP-N-acetylmuramoyl-tripeptide--D-alanyl-D-alanine ligase
VRAKNFYQKDERHLQFELILSKTKESFRVTLPLLGRFNVLNALAAIAVALKMEIPVPEIIKVLSNFEGNEWHMEYLLLDKGITLIQDYYNANPTATKEALQSVVMIAQGRYKAAILGDMLELGDGAIDYHKEIGREAATLSYDMLIAIGEYGNYIIQGAREEGMAKDKTISFKKEEKEKLAQWLSESIPENSIVLMKGSRGIQMEKIVQYWRNIKSRGSHRYA